jgi:hypothetical protein
MWDHSDFCKPGMLEVMNITLTQRPPWTLWFSKLPTGKWRFFSYPKAWAMSCPDALGGRNPSISFPVSLGSKYLGSELPLCLINRFTSNEAVWSLRPLAKVVDLKMKLEKFSWCHRSTEQAVSVLEEVPKGLAALSTRCWSDSLCLGGTNIFLENSESLLSSSTEMPHFS